MKRIKATKAVGTVRPKANRKTEGGQPRNGNAKRHGFYSDLFTEAELALVAAFMDPSLNDEIAMQRVLNRRLMAHANLKDAEGAGPATDLLIKLVEALAIGTGRVASLLRDRRILTSSATALVNEARDTVLVEIGVATGQKL